jgi:hypothetical protein
MIDENILFVFICFFYVGWKEFIILLHFLYVIVRNNAIFIILILFLAFFKFIIIFLFENYL